MKQLYSNFHNFTEKKIKKSFSYNKSKNDNFFDQFWCKTNFYVNDCFFNMNKKFCSNKFENENYLIILTKIS